MSDNSSGDDFPPDEQHSAYSWLIPIITVVVVAAAVIVGLLIQAQLEEPEGPPAPPDELPPAEDLYVRHCAGCHGEDGQGIQARYPSLVDTHWVLEDEQRLILLTLHGLRGPIEVHGRTYDDFMPGFGRRLSNDEIAAILTYIRSSWNNDGDEITVEQVHEMRQAYPIDRGPWTADELDARGND